MGLGKRLKHPAEHDLSTKYNYDAPLFGEGAIPLNRWVGMKYIVYNIDNNTHVKLETYIDTVSDVTNGAPANGGHWELVGSTEKTWMAGTSPAMTKKNHLRLSRKSPEKLPDGFRAVDVAVLRAQQHVDDAREAHVRKMGRAGGGRPC